MGVHECAYQNNRGDSIKGKLKECEGHLQHSKSPKPHHEQKDCVQEGRWVIFNDEKVAVSEHPPIELGYLYLYRRINA